MKAAERIALAIVALALLSSGLAIKGKTEVQGR